MRINHIRANNIKHCSEDKKANNYNCSANNKDVSDSYSCGLSFQGKIKKSSIILKADELVNILKNSLKPENFSTGENYEHVLDGTFSVNMHMHTNCSDGKMTPAEVLQQAVKYADFRKDLGKEDPFIFATTDHGNIKAPLEIINTISENPDKYKNLRYVPGVEINAFYNNRQFELIGYCINPADENFIEVFNNNARKNHDYIESLITNKINPLEHNHNEAAKTDISIKPVDITTFEKARQNEKYLKTGESPALMIAFTRVMNGIFKDRHWKLRQDDVIDSIMQEHVKKFGNESINPGTFSVKQAVEAVKASGGIIGLAHPLRNFGDADFKVLFNEFKLLGVDAVESNYQYKTELTNLNSRVARYADFALMLHTGGHDNHGNNIFRNNNIVQLPEEVRKIIN